MTPKERMLERIRQGRIESELEWCNQVLESRDERSRELKPFALRHKLSLLPVGTVSDDWWRKLRDKELAGHKLGFYQQKIWRDCEGREGRCEPAEDS